MSYGMIGAKAGHRYMFTFNNSQVTAEFYEYDLKNLNDEAKKTIESVKKEMCIRDRCKLDKYIFKGIFISMKHKNRHRLCCHSFK